MYIAQQLRKTSIAEYLLYMWQIEDLIRAYGCSIGRIKREYISKFTNLTPEQQEDELDWFDNLIRMMNEEGKREKGHLNINAIIIQDLEDLHQQLLDSNRFPFYNAEYYKVLPFIVELRRKGNSEVSEIETCFNALYGKMLLQMKQQEISTETEHALTEITTFIGMLSDYYIKNRDEGLDFGNNE